MTAVIIAAAVALQTPAVPSGSELFSKMLKKYSSAKTIRGTITFNQSAQGSMAEAKVAILTSLQASQPNLFFMEQTRTPKSSDPDAGNYFLAVSNGKKMNYTVSKNLLPWTDATSGKHSQFYEDAPKTMAGALDVFCTMLLDRSLPIGIALYNPFEIERVTKNLANLKTAEKEVDVKGKTAFRIDALLMKRYKSGNGTVELGQPIYFYIDKDYNFLGMTLEENVADGAGGTYRITSEWVVNLQVDVEVDKSLFVVK